jgi:cell division transport system permease protein
MFVSLKRIIKSGFKSFYRNSVVSFSAILVLMVTILTLTAMYFGIVLSDASLKQLQQKVDVNVYFSIDAQEDKILSLKDDLEGLEEVDQVLYTSKDQALEEFKERNAAKDVILGALDVIEENPLSANLAIRAKEINQYETIAKFLEGAKTNPERIGLIEDVNYAENKVAIDKLNTLIFYAERIALIVALVFLVISVVITFNTIRLTIYMAKNEISVMRLVGASKSFARGPFLVDGVLYGLISSILSLAILFPVLDFVSPKLNEIFILNIFDYFIDNIFAISGSMILGGVLLGLFSSYLATARYVKV